MSPLFYAILYYAILIIGVHLILRGRVKTMKDFTQGGRSLSWYMVCLGLALIPLGSGHTMSLWEASAGLGSSVLWWGIIVGGVFLPLLMLWFGPWLRELKVETFPESMELMFGVKMRYLHGCVNVASWTGIAMAETLATAGAIYGLTGGAVPYFPWCIIAAFVLIVAYVVLGGVLEYSLISTVNAIVMIVGSYAAMILTVVWIGANGLGMNGVLDYYAKADQLFKFQVFNFTPDLIFQVVIPVAVLHITAAAVCQGMYIPLLSAKSDEDCRKGVFLAAGINGISSFPWVIMAMIAMSIPAIAAGGAKLSAINLALAALPAPIIGLLMICLLAATLSTGSSVMLGNANIIVNDILKRAVYPKMSDETRFKLMRPLIIVCGLLAAIPALFVPIIFPVFLWCFSFGIPVFVVWLIGMVWKTNKAAAWITILVTYAINFIWTFATPTWATGPWGLNMYPVTVSSLVLGIGLNLVLSGDSGLLKRIRSSKVTSDSSIQA